MGLLALSTDRARTEGQPGSPAEAETARGLERDGGLEKNEERRAAITAQLGLHDTARAALSKRTPAKGEAEDVPAQLSW